MAKRTRFPEPPEMGHIHKGFMMDQKTLCQLVDFKTLTVEEWTVERTMVTCAACKGVEDWMWEHNGIDPEKYRELCQELGLGEPVNIMEHRERMDV